MAIVLSIAAAVIGYFVLMFIGVNLIGTIVRGLVRPNPTIQPTAEDISAPGSIGVTVFFSLATIAYLYGLYHFWNMGVVAVAVIVMAVRIPDLLFEIKMGIKRSLLGLSKRPVDTLFGVLGWLALPLLWYSLYFLPGRWVIR